MQYRLISPGQAIQDSLANMQFATGQLYITACRTAETSRFSSPFVLKNARKYGLPIYNVQADWLQNCMDKPLKHEHFIFKHLFVCRVFSWIVDKRVQCFIYMIKIWYQDWCSTYTLYIWWMFVVPLPMKVCIHSTKNCSMMFKLIWNDNKVQNKINVVYDVYSLYTWYMHIWSFG